jgi:hypothetical protein
VSDVFVLSFVMFFGKSPVSLVVVIESVKSVGFIEIESFTSLQIDQLIMRSFDLLNLMDFSDDG